MRAVPNVPLLWLALLLVVPASSAIVYAEDAGKIPGLLLLVAFVLIAVVDFVISRSRLEKLSVEVPDLLRSTKGKDCLLYTSPSPRD